MRKEVVFFVERRSNRTFAEKSAGNFRNSGQCFSQFGHFSHAEIGYSNGIEPEMTMLAVIVRNGGGLFLYAIGIRLATAYGHYVDLIVNHGQSIDLDSVRWMVQTAEACFLIGTVVLLTPVFRRLIAKRFRDLSA